MKRRDVRELVFKTVFANDNEEGDPLRLLSHIITDWEMAGYIEGEPEPKLKGAGYDYAQRLIIGVAANRLQLDGFIDDYSIDWDAERLGRVERAILRICFFELLYGEKLPPAIAINEALYLTKKYASAESVRFVNGVLGKKAEELKDK